MKIKKQITILTVAFLALFGVIAVLLKLNWNKKSVIAPEYVFLYAENQKEDYPTTSGAHYFANLVEERTNGRIKILVKSGGELGVEKDIITQLSFGGVDFARVSLSQLAEKIPEMNVLQLPYLYKNSEHMWQVLDGEIGQYFMKATEEKSIISLSWYDAGARSFYSVSKPITCLEDVKNMRIRIQESELMADMVEAMGAIPMKMEYEDVYSGLQRGIVDAAENNWSSYIFMNHDEVAGYFTVDEHTRVPELQLCSAHTWNLLSKEDQEIIKACAKESALYERGLWKDHEDSCQKKAIQKGVQVIFLSKEEKQKFQNAMASVYKKYSGESMKLIQKIIQYGEEK